MLGLTLDIGETLVIKDADGRETRVTLMGRSGRRARVGLDLAADKQVYREKAKPQGVRK